MTHNWKPGDVALVEAGCHANRVVALRTGVPGYMGWSYCGSHDGKSTQIWSSDDDGIVTPIRPLLVIDPEDREQVERLAEAFGAASSPATAWVDQMRVALRSLLEPEPEQPKRLGSVVRSDDGSTWVRAHLYGATPWVRSAFVNECRGWSDLPRPITVLSDGWQESTDD